MKEFIHPKLIELFYHNEETDELKMIKIPWSNIVKFEMNNITTSIKTHNTMLIKIDVINELNLIANNAICNDDPQYKQPLYKVVPFEFRLYEINIIDSNNKIHTYGVNKNPRHSSSSTRNYNDFKISYS